MSSPLFVASRWAGGMFAVQIEAAYLAGHMDLGIVIAMLSAAILGGAVLINESDKPY